MYYEINGQPFTYVSVKLDRNETIICEAGAMSWMTDGLRFETNAGGIAKAFSRAFSGENMFVNKYTAIEDNQEITFSSKYLGTIIPYEISSNNSIVVQKGAILAYTEGIDRKIHFNRPMKGLFGGEGFIMQEVFGNGMIFLEVDGEIKEYYLDAGETIVLSTGFLLMMDESCTMDIKAVGGIKNSIFGGEGLFNTVVTGPGKVLIQTSPISSLVSTLLPFMPSGK